MKALCKCCLMTLLMETSIQCTPEPRCAPADPTCNDSAIFLYYECYSVLFSGSMQGCPLNLSGEVSTFAGSGAATLTDGIGTAAAFQTPNGSTADGSFLYVADADNGAIRKIDLATRAVTTVVTGLSIPVRDIVADGTYLYVANSAGNNVLRLEIATGGTSTLAGSGVNGTVDGFGTAAQFSFPHAIAVANGFLYVAQNNSAIRRIDLSTTEVTTFAGTAGSNGHLDGPAASALFSQPNGLIVVGNTLYVAEAGSNHTVRKIDLATNIVSTVAGTPGVSGDMDGFGTAALMNDPYSITSDGHSLYVTEFGGHIIRRIELATGRVTRLAGQPGVIGSSDGVFDQALFNQPRGIATDGTYLYISDSTNNTIRRLR